VFETLFKKFDALFGSGRVFASEEVLRELERNGEDDVCIWAKTHRGIFVPIDASSQKVVSHILGQFPKLLDTRTNRSGADPWVIAVGEVKMCTVVTHENATGSPKRPNIPDVCHARGIPVIGVLDLIKAEGWKV
jgi:hypothetical protein